MVSVKIHYRHQGCELIDVILRWCERTGLQISREDPGFDHWASWDPSPNLLNTLSQCS